jgi:phosphatidate cytidylyltransferase
MLKQRILTAIVLIPVFITLLFTLSPRGFCIFTGILVLLASYEWSQFLGLKTFPKNIIFPFIMIVLLINTLYFVANHYISIPTILWMAFAFWLLALFWVVRYPNSTGLWSKNIFFSGCMGVLTLIPCWLALNFIRGLPAGLTVLCLLFILIWGADTGAYFAGRRFGKHKLLVMVSPGKTWEGLAGALLTTAVIIALAIYFLHLPFNKILPLLLLGWGTVLFSVLGDLFESMLKRNAQVKDSGKILPGHGGILDRIDSLTAGAPIFALGLILLQ